MTSFGTRFGTRSGTKCIMRRENGYYKPGQSVLYRMAFTSCRCDRPSQSNRPGNRAVLARFSPFSIFPFPMLNQWSTRARADATPSVVPGPNLNTQVGPYQRTCCPIFLHLAPVVFELLTFSCMTDGRTYVLVRTYVPTDIL